MKAVSGKIDRKCLPDLSDLLQGAEPEAEAVAGATPAATRGTVQRFANAPDADAGMTPECEEVLAICRAVLETPLGPDDGFAEAGGHSILIARLAQKLQAAGWAVSVRALLSDATRHARWQAGRARLSRPSPRRRPVRTPMQASPDATRPRRRCSPSASSPPCRSSSRPSSPPRPRWGWFSPWPTSRLERSS